MRGPDLAVGGLGGALLGLLLGAAVAVAEDQIADADARDEGLHVVGAVVLDEVLGDTQPEVGGELLEGGLPVEAGTHGRGGLHHRVEEPVDHLGGLVDATAEVDRTDHRLDGVGEDRGLVATAGRLLAAAQLDVLAEAYLTRDVGQRAGVDHGRAQLGEPPLGEVRVGEVERLGHHDPEHRVAEELQALVGRDLPVLVGVRAVRQRALQQLGIQDRITERCAELVGGQRTWRRSALAPYWPHWPHARCGRCLAPQAGLAHVARDGATAFHCERR